MNFKVIFLIIVLILVLLLSLMGSTLKEASRKGLISKVPDYNCGGDICTSCIIEGNACSCGTHTCDCGNKSVDLQECTLN